MATTNTYNINVNASQAQQALQGLQTALSTTNNAFNSLKGVLGGLALGALIVDLAKSANEIKKFSDATQISISAISNWQKEFRKVGGTSENATDALSDFVKNLGEAANSGGDLVQAFNRVGVSLNDIRTLSEKALLEKTVAGLKDIADPATRSSIAMKIFGESVKGLDLTQINEGFSKYTAESLRNADAIRKAAQAERDLSNAYAELKTQLMAALAPLASLISALTSNQDATRALISFLLELAAVLGTLYIVTKVADGFLALRAALLGTAALGTRFIPIVGAIATALIALNEITRAFSGNSLVEWMGKLKDKLFGASDASSEFTQEMADQKNESEKLADANDRRIKFLDKEKQALNQIVEAYARSNKEANTKYELDTALIGASEQLKNKENALHEASAKYLTEINKLRDQYNQKKVEGADPEQLAAIEDAAKRITDSYEEQKAKLVGLADARTKATQAEELHLFQIKSLVEANRQYNDLVSQTSTLMLPELEKRYKNIEINARAAAEAQIASEEARRNAPMSESEKAKYYEAAAQGADKLKTATKALYDEEVKREKTLAWTREQVQVEQDLQKIRDDMATMTMTELEKKEYAVAAAARDRARAFIEAENARTNTKMSQADEQAIIDQYVAGSKKLIGATDEAYAKSREFSVGWQQAMNDYVASATDGAARAKDIFNSTFKGMEDLIINFAKTGKFEWKGFINSLIEQMVRSELQSTMARIFSFGKGGGSSGSGLFAGLFADGGTIPAGKWGIAGEAGPEVINGPATVTPMSDLASGGGTTNITYNISAVDAKSFQQLVASDPSFIYAVTLKGQRAMPRGI